MGQAKSRGGFEQRKAAAEERARLEAIEVGRRLEAQREAAWAARQARLEAERKAREERGEPEPEPDNWSGRSGRFSTLLAMAALSLATPMAVASSMDHNLRLSSPPTPKPRRKGR